MKITKHINWKESKKKEETKERRSILKRKRNGLKPEKTTATEKRDAFDDIGRNNHRGSE
jgi:hypothetical protein